MASSHVPVLAFVKDPACNEKSKRENKIKKQSKIRKKFIAIFFSKYLFQSIG